MSHSIYGKRIDHGALLIDFMSTASIRMIEESVRKGIDSTPAGGRTLCARALQPSPSAGENSAIPAIVVQKLLQCRLSPFGPKLNFQLSQ
jgi:hypothetical protein